MSILFLADAAGGSNFPPATVAVAAVVALGMGAIGGILNPRRIAGPQRLSPGESPRVLLEVIGLAVMAWAAANLVLAAYLQFTGDVQSKATTVPSPMSAVQQVVFSSIMDAAVLAAVLAATVMARPEGIKRMGIDPGKFLGGLARGLFGTIMVFPLVIYLNGAVELILQRLGWRYPMHPFLQILHSHPGPWLSTAIVLSAGVLAPLAEEMLFRGQVQTVLRYWLGRPWPAVFFAAALFAMAHYQQPAAWPALFFLGICLGYAYERTGNLWISIVVHSLFNLGSIFLALH